MTSETPIFGSSFTSGVQLTRKLGSQVSASERGTFSAEDSQTLELGAGAHIDQVTYWHSFVDWSEFNHQSFKVNGQEFVVVTTSRGKFTAPKNLHRVSRIEIKYTKADGQSQTFTTGTRVLSDQTTTLKVSKTERLIDIVTYSRKVSVE